MGVGDLLEVIGLGLASGGIGGLVTLFRRKPRVRPIAEPTCTGYVSGKDGDQKKDCEALRSATCSDGRCSFHCQKTCDCDGAERMLTELEKLRRGSK